MSRGRNSAEQRHADIDYTQLKRLIQLNDRMSSAEETHKGFMEFYDGIFQQPQTSLPKKQLKGRMHPPVKPSLYESVQEVNRHQPHGKLAQESLMNQAIKALKKLPIERSQSEHHAINKLLKGVHSLSSQLGLQELKHISTITTVETWDRGQIIFAHNGFYLVLKGSVKPFNHETLREDQTVSTIATGGSFGSCEPVNAAEGSDIVQCVLTLETCEILKISRSGYEKLKKDILARDHEVKAALIQGCQLYLHWPKLSINHLVDGMQLKTFPANQVCKHPLVTNFGTVPDRSGHPKPAVSYPSSQPCYSKTSPPNTPSPILLDFQRLVGRYVVLVKEGKICSFVAFIARGECNILQDARSLIKSVDTKSCRVRSVVVGKLGPKQSFGEVSILLDQPSPCTVITATEVHGGIIQPECVKGLDSVTTALILQTAQPVCGKLSEEEVMKEFLTQERMKKWELEKRKILSAALFYNGVQPGRGKWTFNRGPRGKTEKSNKSI